MSGRNARATNCPFCDRSDYVMENDLAYTIYDMYPASEGHMLIVPKRHVESLFETRKEEKRALLELLEKARDFLIAKHRPDGFNIGINEGRAAGQTIGHLHVHCIPRYRGDVEDPTGGVRGAIPEKRIYPTKKGV